MLDNNKTIMNQMDWQIIKNKKTFIDLVDPTAPVRYTAVHRQYLWFLRNCCMNYEQTLL